MSEISLTGDQMLSVLETIALRGPLSAAETARHCGINRTVAHRLLTTLAKRSYIQREERGYVVGPSLFELFRHAAPELNSIAKPVMDQLAEQYGETVVLHGIHGVEAIVLDQSVGRRHLVRVEHTPGSRHPLFLGASGWSILAFQNDRMIARALRNHPEQEAAKQQIEQVRRAGYAITKNELQLGVYGLAVPLVIDSAPCTASLAILVPESRASVLESLIDPLLEVARKITTKLS